MNLRTRRVASRVDTYKCTKEFANMSVDGKCECEYFNRSSEPVKIILKQASIVDQVTDAIVVTINKRLITTAAVHNKIGALIGSDNYKDAIQAAKNQYAIDNKRAHHGGSVIPVNVQNIYQSPWKCIFLVVEPSRETIEQAYKTVFDACFTLQYKTLALVGIGCGDIGLSPAESSGMAYSALMGTDDKKRLTTLKAIFVCDLKSRVVDGFLQQLCQLATLQEMMMVPRPAGSAPARLKSQFAMPRVSPKDASEVEQARTFTKTMGIDQVAADAECVICLDTAINEDKDEVVALQKCGHLFHFDCFLNFIKQCQTHKSCPVCRRFFDLPKGNQPIGSTMRDHILRNTVLPGHEDESRNTIEINYHLPNGVQGSEHPRPGVPFRGTSRTAYLPDSEEGRKVLALLKKAFELRLVFTVGDSITTGAKDVVTWSNIHHKTSMHGGPHSFGYPDPTYLARVTSELKEAGVTEELLNAD